MKKFFRKPRVLVTGSLWALFIYLVNSSLEDIKRTHYFFIDTGIHPSVRKNFKCHTFNTVFWDDKYRLSVLYYSIARFMYRIRWPYLLFGEIFGIDLDRECQAVVGYRKYTLIEDGLGDYYIGNCPLRHHIRFRYRLLYGPLYGKHFGNNRFCKAIILTQEPTTPVMLEKGTTINIQQLWQASSQEKKDYILSLFNISLNDEITMKSRECLILTQPLSEDKTMSEDEKISIYQRYIDKFGEENTIIKTHPREKTDYRKYFPLAVVFDKIAPMQLFKVMGIRFKNVATFASSSALDFLDNECNLIFEGTTNYPSVEEKYGHITLELLKSKAKL